MTNDGKTEIAKWFAGESATSPTHFAVGTDSTTPNVTDSTLIAEVFRDSVDSVSRTGTLIRIDSVLSSLQATGSTVNEVGILNAATDGTLFSRNVFADLIKTDEIELQIESRFNIQ